MGKLGVELELLAPEGKTRFDVAQAIARAVDGRVVYGLKHVVDGMLGEHKPRCSLSLAARVIDADGRALATLVDDVTIRAHVEPDAKPEVPVIVVDDTRISKWLEACSFVSETLEVDKIVAPLLDTFGGSIVGARIQDPWGQTLALILEEPAAHHRACEIVTRPLDDGERETIIETCLIAANALGCTVPAEAALHLHVDAAAWESAIALKTLILAWDARRGEIHERLHPNPRCKKLGPFPNDVVRVAKEVPFHLPFKTLAAALKLAGAKKDLDVNIVGVIDPHPAQPTLEVRCLPMSLDPDAVNASIDEALRILDEIQATC